MNYLAHAYLSFQQPGILTGNMISDYVKGKIKYTYTADIQKGIALHRAIDEFTDFHPLTREAKKVFHDPYRLYSGAFVDVVYDHFLANDVNEFSEGTALEAFTLATYQLLQAEDATLPAKFSRMLPYMQQQNWLYHYRFKEGIEKSFGGLAQRAAYLSESAIAFRLFNQHYHTLEACYRAFFPELKKFARDHLTALNTMSFS